VAKNLMIQGTASSVGKSIITAGLCRVFAQDGMRVAPFKSQNMALNSFVTREGHEMGRAQVLQAAACFREPSVLMNPVLLKPSSDIGCQVIINGKVHKNMSASDYQEFKPELKKTVLDAYHSLENDNDIIVIEGAGSPAEINLREHDIVNMGMAQMVDAPVILVADIDRGGVFASVVGTMFLLSEDEKKRVKGIIINKFRGDVEILKPGLDELERIINVPVLGVMPYFNILLEDEDSVTERFAGNNKNGAIDICIVKTPWISNFTDFDVFYHIDDICCRYATSALDIGEPDVLILPGSKNTIADLEFIRSAGIDAVIGRLHKKGTVIFGVCGGFQMMGSSIDDPYAIEGSTSSCDGLGLIAMTTTLQHNKITEQVSGIIATDSGILEGLKGTAVSGYEIHMGRSTLLKKYEQLTEQKNIPGGIVADNCIGTYMHGIFDSMVFTVGLINTLRKRKGLSLIAAPVAFDEVRENEFCRLAAYIREYLDMKKIYMILERDDCSSR
jgi:adenosylcobyric acid synthase